MNCILNKHKGKGVVLDSNLFLLLLVGRHDIDDIKRCKRTDKYNREDYETLVLLLDWFGHVVTMPNILTEVSNLALPFNKSRQFEPFREFGALIRSDAFEEHYEQSKPLTGKDLFIRLGLTDQAIAEVSSRGLAVLSDDLPLCVQLQSQGIDALNFNHLRTAGWKA